MDVWEVVALFAAGIVAGAINAVVGSGTLVTFPTLLALGYPPVLANVSNNIGLVPGSASGAWAYRRELAGQRSRVLRLAGCSIAGGIIGAILLLELPESAFDAIVPVLILLAVVLVIIGPRLNRLVAKREGAPPHGGVAVLAAVFTVNGGYGSGQQFVDGMNPAVTIGAALVAVGAIAAFAIKRSPGIEPVAVVGETPFVTACACASCWCAPPADTPETEDHDVGDVKIPVLAGVS
jgi:uncharacterized membrane protein YfcA